MLSAAAGADGQEDGGLAQVLGLLLALLLWNRYGRPALPSHTRGDPTVVSPGGRFCVSKEEILSGSRRSADPGMKERPWKQPRGG